MTQKQCNHCLKWKDETEFSWRWKALGIRNPSCKDCQYEHNKKYYEGSGKERHLQQVKERTEAAREAAREYVTQYLLAHPCQSCGETDIRALEFHHRDGNTKDMTITRMVTGGWSVKRIAAEISKCDVLCASCHRKLTADERGWYRSKR